jgi:hypothetical protein
MDYGSADPGPNPKLIFTDPQHRLLEKTGFVYRLFEVGGGKGDVMVGVYVDVWQGFRILCAHYNLVKKSLHIKATPRTRRNEYDMKDALSSIPCDITFETE